MQCWLVRNKNNRLFLCFGHVSPIKDKKKEIWKPFSIYYEISEEDLKSLHSSKEPKWEDSEPMKVDLSMEGLSLETLNHNRYAVYTETDVLESLLFFWMGGGSHTYKVKIEGIDWRNKKILIQKVGSTKYKWYPWSDFTFSF